MNLEKFIELFDEKKTSPYRWLYSIISLKTLCCIKYLVSTVNKNFCRWKITEELHATLSYGLWRRHFKKRGTIHNKPKSPNGFFFSLAQRFFFSIRDFKRGCMNNSATCYSPQQQTSFVRTRSNFHHQQHCSFPYNKTPGWKKKKGKVAILDGHR